MGNGIYKGSVRPEGKVNLRMQLGLVTIEEYERYSRAVCSEPEFRRRGF
jgi:hypothetical protein